MDTWYVHGSLLAAPLKVTLLCQTDFKLPYLATVLILANTSVFPRVGAKQLMCVGVRKAKSNGSRAVFPGGCATRGAPPQTPSLAAGAP